MWAQTKDLFFLVMRGIGLSATKPIVLSANISKYHHDIAVRQGGCISTRTRPKLGSVVGCVSQQVIATLVWGFEGEGVLGGQHSVFAVSF